MTLPTVPFIKKFFTNKIESSQPEWGDYLLEIADIFSTFDGEDLDRDLLAERFSVISGRSAYALRDVSNFRDEFGAYGTYLGLFHIVQNSERWRIVLSGAAKHFLCSTEPDVESFCRTQLSLFQYPNGAGAVQHQNGSVWIQQNVKADTVREIQNSVRINPLRLICRIAVVMHEIDNTPLRDIVIPYSTIFMLFNDSRVNTNYSPSLEALVDVLSEYQSADAPTWATSGSAYTKFKRNFHIFERIGCFSRTGHVGFMIKPMDHEKSYSYIKSIGEMTCNFEAFEPAYGCNDENVIDEIIASTKWGEYFDALKMPTNVLQSLSDAVGFEDSSFFLPPIPSNTPEQAFPDLREYQSNQTRAFLPTGNRVDPYETIVRREKANREHARILNILAATLRMNDYCPYENTFVDLSVEANGLDYIFEVKSNNKNNTLSQIRKAVSQLYEYRYRSGKSGALLCVVLQQQPDQEWIKDYLINDRKLLICWLVDDIRLECPDECHEILSSIGLVE